jgi:hypothetical protein
MLLRRDHHRQIVTVLDAPASSSGEAARQLRVAEQPLQRIGEMSIRASGVMVKRSDYGLKRLEWMTGGPPRGVGD